MQQYIAEGQPSGKQLFRKLILEFLVGIKQSMNPCSKDDMITWAALRRALPADGER